MDVLTSTEFRKRYASLTEQTEVTAGKRLIGLWVPVPPNRGAIKIEAWITGAAADDDAVARQVNTQHNRQRFATRPFTPVPKPGRRP
jgi:hypothetical protein